MNNTLMIISSPQVVKHHFESLDLGDIPSFDVTQLDSIGTRNQIDLGTLHDSRIGMVAAN
jgi:hypothetical protein